VLFAFIFIVVGHAPNTFSYHCVPNKGWPVFTLFLCRAFFDRTRFVIIFVVFCSCSCSSSEFVAGAKIMIILGVAENFEVPFRVH